VPHHPRPFFKKSHRCWYVQIGGRQLRLSADREEAFREYHRLMGDGPKQIAAGPPADAAVVTDLINKFLDWCQEHRSPNTFEWYRWKLEIFDREVSSGMALSELKPFHLDDWFQKHPEWSSGTKHGFARAIMRVLSWAKKRGRIEHSPLAGYEKHRPGKRTAVISPEEFAGMLALVPRREFKDLLTVTWETGARPQESLAVEARHVDLAKARWVFPPEESKGEEWPRVVYLTPAALEITGRLVTRWPEGPLFRNSDGLPWTTDAVNCAFIRLQISLGMKRVRELGLMPPKVHRLRGAARKDSVKRAEHLGRLGERRNLVLKLAKAHGRKCCLYTLRHTWLNRALTSGVDALTAAVLMGHRDPGTIAKTYQHLSQNPDYLLKEARKAGGNGAEKATGGA
jgi:integrase